MQIPILKNLGRKNSVGIDLGGGAFKFARLATTAPDRHKLVFLDSFEVPKDSDQLPQLLKEFVSRHKLADMPAAVSFQDETLHIRKLELPKMPAEDLKEAVRWQMRDIAEGSMDDYVVSHSTVREQASADVTRLTLLGYAVKKPAMRETELLLQKAGLKPFFMEPTPVSLAHSVERVSPSPENTWTGCVDIGMKKSYFIAIGFGRLQFVRYMSGISLAQAQELKENYPAKLAVEIQHAIDAFSIACHVERLEKIILAGGGASLDGLSPFLSQNIGITTEVLNPFQGIEGTAPFLSAQQKPYLFGPALALALIKP